MGGENFSPANIKAKSVGRGFTLIELLIVVAAIGILSLLVIWALNSSLLKSKDAKRKSDLDRIKIATEEYEKDHNCYPPPDLMYCDKAPPGGTIPGSGLRPYLSLIPCDPITKTSYFYYYDGSSCPVWFKVYTVLQNASDPSVMPNIGPFSSFNYVVTSANAPLEVSVAPSPSPSGSGSPQSGFYGCIDGACVPIAWDPTRPGPECDVNYQQSDCITGCVGKPNCKPWNQ